MAFTRAQAAEAARVPVDTLSGWTRPDANLPILTASERDRWRHGYDRPTILQLAIMRHLSDIGMPVGRAARAAVVFSHTGTDHFDDETDSSPVRRPGELFASGRTILVVRAGAEHADVVNLNDSEPFFAAWSALAAGAEGVVLVDVGPIYREVVSTLKLLS